MPPRKSTEPVSEDVWRWAFRAKALFRLTDAQIGEWLGYSTPRVKQKRRALTTKEAEVGGGAIGEPGPLEG